MSRPKSTPRCSVEGCERSIYGRGWCNKHWARWYRHGDTSLAGHWAPPTERFWAAAGSPGPDCWLWSAARTGAGYGVLAVAGKMLLAHRFAYELLVGPIPEGLQIDHLCRNRGCVNPAHLEPVTCQVNLLRGINRNRDKTHCWRGHEFTAANTRLTRNGRTCKACDTLTQRERRHRKRDLLLQRR